MVYRLAEAAELPAISYYLTNHVGYYGMVRADELGGNWLIALDDEGDVRGTLWEFHGDGNAYVDYWAADMPLVAATLAAMMEIRLKVLGIEKVWSVIMESNRPARRLAAKLGMDPSFGYALATKRL